jgi:hypothetical protein
MLSAASEDVSGDEARFGEVAFEVGFGEGYFGSPHQTCSSSHLRTTFPPRSRRRSMRRLCPAYRRSGRLRRRSASHCSPVRRQSLARCAGGLPCSAICGHFTECPASKTTRKMLPARLTETCFAEFHLKRSPAEALFASCSVMRRRCKTSEWRALCLIFKGLTISRPAHGASASEHCESGTLFE